MAGDEFVPNGSWIASGTSIVQRLPGRPWNEVVYLRLVPDGVSDLGSGRRHDDRECIEFLPRGSDDEMISQGFIPNGPGSVRHDVPEYLPSRPDHRVRGEHFAPDGVGGVVTGYPGARNEGTRSCLGDDGEDEVR